MRPGRRRRPRCAAAGRSRAPCWRSARWARRWRSSTPRSSTSPSPISRARIPRRRSRQLSWVLNAYNIVFAAFLVAAGRLADLIGRRRVFISGLELFTVASVLCAVAPSPGTLTAFRRAPGARGGAARPVVARPGARRVPGRAPIARRGAAVRGRRGRRPGSAPRSAGFWSPPATGGSCSSSTCRSASRRSCSRAAIWSRAVRPAAGGCPTCRARSCWRWRSRRSSWRSSRARNGAGSTHGCWARSPRRSCSERSSSGAARRIARRSSTSRCCATGRSASPTPTTLLTGAGFYGYTLVNVLFLTAVWDYSVLEAGLALTPGPFVAAAVAGPTSHLVMRIGARPVLVAGGLLWGAAVFWFVARVGVTPDFVGEWLPGILLLGLGAGTLLPNLTAAAVASAPGSRVRDGHRPELRRASDRRGTGRRARRRDPRDTLPGRGRRGVRSRLDVRRRVLHRRRARLPPRRAPDGSRAAVAGVRSSRRAGRRADVRGARVRRRPPRGG